MLGPYIRSNIKKNSGFSLAEVVMIIVITGYCMIPIIGSLQNGAAKTQQINHRKRLQMIVRNKLNECISNITFERGLPETGARFFYWPPPKDDELASWTFTSVDSKAFWATATKDIYLLETTMAEEIQFENEGSSSNVDSELIATQPLTLKKLIVRASYYATYPVDLYTETIDIASDGTQIWNDINSNGVRDQYDSNGDAVIDGSDEIEPWVMVETLAPMIDVPEETAAAYTFVNIPVKRTPDKIYVSNTQGQTQHVHLFDPESLTESGKISFTPDNCLGHIAVHPSGKWLAAQKMSFGRLIPVEKGMPDYLNSGKHYFYSSSGAIKNGDLNELRKDRGMAFRQDGRYLAMAEHKTGNLIIYNLSAFFTATYSATIADARSVVTQKTIDIKDGLSDKTSDLCVGDDGFVYIAYEDKEKIARVNLYQNPTPAKPEIFNVSGKAKGGVCVSRDGRYLFVATEDKTYQIKINPYSFKDSEIIYSPTLPEQDEIKDIQVSSDNKYLVVSLKRDSGASTGYRDFIYIIELPLNSSNTNSSNFRKVKSKYGDMSYLAKASPNLDKIVFEYFDDYSWQASSKKKNTKLVTFKISEFAALSPGASVADDNSLLKRFTFPDRKAEMADIAARVPEYVYVGTENGLIECIDLHRMEKNDERLISLATGKKAKSISLNPAGTKILVSDLSNNWGKAYDLKKMSLITTGDTIWGGGDVVKMAFDIEDNSLAIKRHMTDSANNGLYGYDTNYSSRLANLDISKDFTPYDIVTMNDGGLLVLSTRTGGVTRLDWYGYEESNAEKYKKYATWVSSADNFPPAFARKIAINADDSLIAFAVEDPDPTAPNNEYVYIYDWFNQNFGDKTQIPGMIFELRNNTSTLSGPISTKSNLNLDLSFLNVSANTHIKLIDAFTNSCTRYSQPLDAYLKKFPGNFFYENTYNWFKQESSRFFGYYRPQKTYQSAALCVRDGGKFLIDGRGESLNWGAGGHFQKSYPLSGIDAYTGYPLQIEHSSNSDYPNGTCLLVSTSADPGHYYNGGTSSQGMNFSYNGSTLVGVKDSDLGTAITFAPIPETDTKALNFAPQFLHRVKIPGAFQNSVEMVFSRDIASPTIYCLNKKTGLMVIQPFGGDKIPFMLNGKFNDYHGTGSTINTGAYCTGLAISNDGQKLLITTKSGVDAQVGNKIYFMDISATPDESPHYLKIVKSEQLMGEPISIATRPFTRYKSKSNVYEHVAELPTGVPGYNTSALASGGIYIAEGTEARYSSSHRAGIHKFDPYTNNVSSFNLSAAVKFPGVCSYEGDVFVITGEVDEIQRFRPNIGKTSYSGEEKWSTSNYWSESGVKSSYSQTDFEDKKAFNGISMWTDTGTIYSNCWRAPTGNWIQYDFKAPIPIGKIKIVSKSSVDPSTLGSFVQHPAKDIKIYGTNDGSTLVLLKEFTLADSSSMQEIPINTYRGFRYYRIETVSNYCGCGETDIYEIEFWGPKSKKSTRDDNSIIRSPITDVLSATITPYGIVFGGGSSGTANDEFFVYWPHAKQGDEWGLCRELPKFPQTIADHNLIYHKDRLYCLFGASNHDQDPYDKIRTFDFANNSWNTSIINLADDSSDIKCAAAASFGDEIYVFGGSEEDDFSNITSKAFAWNPIKNTKRALGNVPQTKNTSDALALRTGMLTAVRVGPYIYLIGGMSNDPNSTSSSGKEILRYIP
jgi:hypothetical protein